MPIEEVRRQFYTLCFFLFGTIALVALPAFLDYLKQPNVQDVVVETPTAPVRQEKPDPFKHLSLTADAMYVYDVTQDKVLFSKNEHKVLPLASVTKLMTALVGSEYIDDTDLIEISADALGEEGDSGLFMYEKWRPHDLIGYTLLVSSNDGAHAVASAGGVYIARMTDAQATSTKAPRELFVEEMNKVARTLKLGDLHFFNETGLDIEERVAGAYGSAHDVARLLAHMTKEIPEVLEPTRYDVLQFQSLNHFEHLATNTNISARAIPGLIGSKTGFTDLAGGNLAVTFDAGLNYPIVVVVLGSTVEERFSDVEALVWASLESLAR